MIHDLLCPLQMDWHDTPCGLCNLVRRARAHALDEAREAVAAVIDETDSAVWFERFRDDPDDIDAITVMVQLDRALAAIDALRGES